MALAKDPEINYAKSTGAFPMDPEPANVFVDSAIDYTKSTMAYPMYDQATDVPVTAEHVGAAPVVRFETPGPASYGDPTAIARQVEHLGLVADAAETKQVDGDDTGADTADVDLTDAAAETKQVDGDQVDVKVIEPPESDKPAGRTRARGK